MEDNPSSQLAEHALAAGEAALGATLRVAAGAASEQLRALHAQCPEQSCPEQQAIYRSAGGIDVERQIFPVAWSGTTMTCTNKLQ